MSEKLINEFVSKWACSGDSRYQKDMKKELHIIYQALEAKVERLEALLKANPITNGVEYDLETIKALKAEVERLEIKESDWIIDSRVLNERVEELEKYKRDLLLDFQSWMQEKSFGNLSMSEIAIEYLNQAKGGGE